jgi:TolB protein
VMNADGTERKDLGPGCMPSFSADGKRLVFSEPGHGIMTMNSDGTDRQTIDRSGWGAQWSPDGKWIAYGKSGNITLVDVATRKSRQLLAGVHAKRYGIIYWNMAWSHDSRGIAFKGSTRTGGKAELAFAEIDSPERLQVLQTNAEFTYPDISFSPDNKQVIAAIDNHDGTGYRLHAINIKQLGLPKLLEVIPAGESSDGVAWSRDGKSIAISVLDVAQPTEWVTGMKTD